MIEKIRQLKIEGRCFHPYKNLNCFNNEKAHISIIYGKNGSGKSTISKAVFGQEDLKCTYLDEDENELSFDEHSVFVFNEEYIRNKVEIKDDGLDAVVLFGEQVEIDKKLDKLNSELYDNKRKLAIEEEEKSKLENKKEYTSYLFKLEKIKNKLKSPHNWVERSLMINRDRKAPNITLNLIKDIFKKPTTKNINEAQKLFDERLSILKNDTLGKVPNSLNKININKDFFKEVEKLLAVKVEHPRLSERDKLILSIVEERGNTYLDTIKDSFSNQSQKFCPFCFRDISDSEKSDIIVGIEKVLNKAVEDHKIMLVKHKNKIGNLIDNLDKTMSTADMLKDIYSEKFLCFYANFKIMNSLLCEYFQKIDEKINNLFVPLEFENKEIINQINKLNDSIDDLENKRVEFNTSIDEIDIKREQAIEYNKEIAYWELIDDYNDYCNAFEKHKNCVALINKLESDIKDNENEISLLNDKKKCVTVAKDHINKALEYIFFTKERLQLDVENGKYFLISKNVRVTPDKVSTGERNIIALCYFFTQMLDNHNLNDNYMDECFIIIDDPVSSFDVENKVGVSTYLKFQISEILHGNANSKIVFMSHDLSTIFDFQKAAKEIATTMNSNNKFFESYELIDFQLIPFSESRKDRHEYSVLMKEIYKYAKNEETQLSDFSVGNSMRRLLEAYGTFIYKKGIEELTTNDAILDLCGNHKKFYKNFMYRLVLNGESHFKERVLSLEDTNFFEFISTEQKRVTAQRLIAFLFLINPLHVKEHLDKKEDVESTVNGWINDLPCDESQ